MDALVVLILVAEEVVRAVPVLVELDVVAAGVVADVLVAALALAMLVLVLRAVVMLVAVLVVPLEPVDVDTVGLLVLVVELVGRMTRSSMISTSVGRLALVTLVVVAAVLVVRPVPLSIG